MSGPTTSALGLELGDPVLDADLRRGLAAVEDLLHSSVRSDDPFIAEAARFLVDAGGKRLRPLMTLTCAHLGSPAVPEVVTAAAVVELTHLATLYHDDVMDEAEVRRGSASANARWDNTVAILTGDFLFSRASELLADLGPWAVRLQATTFARLVSGQIRETVGPRDGEDPVAHHLGVLADKTGSLIATSAEFGARFSGASDAATEVVRRYAEQLGVAFQISDDIIDIASDTTDSGKTPGTDLREGVPTLPVLFALRDDSPEPDAVRLRSLVSRPLVDDDEHAEALALMRRSPALAQARQTLQTYADSALAILSGLPDGPPRRALVAVVHGVVERTG